MWESWVAEVYVLVKCFPVTYKSVQMGFWQALGRFKIPTAILPSLGDMPWKGVIEGSMIIKIK